VHFLHIAFFYHLSGFEEEKKSRLKKIYRNLNPVSLKREIDRKKKLIAKLSKN